MANTRDTEPDEKYTGHHENHQRHVYHLLLKIKKARKTLTDTEPYFYSLQQMISRILRHIPRWIIPISTPALRSNRGPQDRLHRGLRRQRLAGAYNHNVFKLVEEQLEKPGTPALRGGRSGPPIFRQKGHSRGGTVPLLRCRTPI